MKKLFSVCAILGVIGTAALMSGCGGSDHNDNNVVTPTSFAPASVANNSVTLTENGQSRDIQFSTTGNSFTQFENGTTNAVGTGTFQYTKQGDNNGQLVLITSGDNSSTNQVTYVLNFTSATTGTYTYTTSAGTTGSGTFNNLQQITGGNNGGGNNGGGDNGGGNNGGGNNGGGNNGGGGTTDTPTSIAGHAIDFTAAGAGNEKLTFAGTGNSVTSDAINPPNNVGTYTYTPATGGAPATLVITFPNGDSYNLNMTFTDATHGTWGGSQKFDNSDHPVPAGSSFTIQP